MGWAKSDARVKQLHACINCVKVIKLPSHSSCKLNNLKRQWMEENGLTCFWRWWGGLQRSGFTLFCVWLSLLFSFCFCDDEGAGFLFGFFFFWFEGGDEKTVMLTLVFWVFCLRLSFFMLCVLGFFLCFSGFLFPVLSPFCWFCLFSSFSLSFSLVFFSFSSPSVFLLCWSSPCFFFSLVCVFGSLSRFFCSPLFFFFIPFSPLREVAFAQLL